MIDAFLSRAFSVASPGTAAWLALAAFIAGLSRGLTGFGAGMIFVPIAGGLVGPVPAIGLLWTIDAPTVVPLGLRSIPRAQIREIAVLFGAWLISTPLGFWLLGWFEPITIRWIVCLMILSAMALLMSGWRFQGHPTPRLAAITGLIAGITGGLSGLPGPPIVMLWLAAAAATAHNLRDNINLFFLGTLGVYCVLLPWYGILTWEVVYLGLLLCLPYTAAIGLGTLAYNRLSARDYRRAAYIVIGSAALLALPLLDPLFGR